MDVPFSSLMEPVEERSLQFRKEKGIFVCRVVRFFAVVIGHQRVETCHQALDIDMPLRMAASFPIQQTARVRQATDLVLEDIVVEVVDEQRRAGDDGAAETGAGDYYVIAGDGLLGMRMLFGRFLRGHQGAELERCSACRLSQVHASSCVVTGPTCSM